MTEPSVPGAARGTAPSGSGTHPGPGRRRRFTPEQKRALLDEAARPGGSIFETARQYGLAPSLLLRWKRVMDDASQKGLKRNERVVAESEVKQLK